MARFLIPASTGMYRVNFDAFDGDMMKLAFAEPVPWPLRNLTPRSGYGGGAPVLKDHMPTKMRVSGRGARLRLRLRLVDFNSAYHIYFVNRRFIDVVEQFQKEIQYFLVECFWSGKTPAGEYFFFFTTVMLDAVIREKTTATWTPTLPGKGLWQPRLDLGETFAFDKSRLGDKHLWVDPHVTAGAALVSDALYAALREAKIEGFQDGPHFAEV